MNKRWSLLSIFFVLAASLCARAADAPADGSLAQKIEPSAGAGAVVVIPVKGAFEAAQLEEFKKALEQAGKDGAKGIILDMDTAGGDLKSLEGAMDAMLAVKVPTAAFVNTKALAGGAVLALAADKIYMHPSGMIGSVALATGTTGKDPATALVEKARALAKAKNHPEDVAEAFVRQDAEVKRGDKVLDGKNTLLLLTAADATIRHYGHPVLAEATAGDTAAVAKLAGFTGAIKTVTSTTLESPAFPAVIPGPTGKGPIFVIPLRTEVGPPQFYFLRRALKEAQRANASAVIVEIDTFGGRVDSAMEEMDALLAMRIPTYAFVNTKAISAGSMISLATKKIYMHPSAVIGASAVVSGGGEEMGKTMSEKATSMVAAKARSAAQASGHPEDVAEAFVRIEAELSRDGKVIDGKETLLTLNTSQATKSYAGAPLLAAGEASTIEELVRKAGLQGEIRRFEPSGFESLAFWITAISPLLLIGGIVGAYIEMKAPGFGIPGICSLICFGLFFGGHYIAGLAGMESMILFVIGLALVIVEVFVVPGTIIPGLIGTLFMLGAIVFAMVDRWPSEGGEWSMPTGAQLERPMLNLILALVGAGVAMMLLAKFLPKTALYGRLVLSNAIPGGVGVTVPAVNIAVKVGETGTASTTLRPAGKAEIGGQIHDVVSEGEFISPGTAIRVVSTDGMRILVEPVENA